MKTIVITGSTRGIGHGLATEFVKSGQRVVINGRSQAAVDKAVAKLRQFGKDDQVIGCPADITKYEQVQAIWQKAVDAFGKVDIWISNAGVMNKHDLTWNLEPNDIRTTVEVNSIGLMYCAKVAISGMLQQGFGHIYNFEGFGSDGKQFQPGMIPYGATKAGVRYFTKSLSRELKKEPITIGTISPGIVVTDLLREPYNNRPKEWAKAKKIFNILGDTVETVSAHIAKEALAGKKRIEWLTVPKAAGRFMTAGFKKRDLFANDPAPNKMLREAHQ